MTSEIESDPQGIAARLAAELRRIREQTDDPRQDAARAVGEALRQAIDRLTATSAPETVLLDAAERIGAVVGLIEDHRGQRGYQGQAEASGLGHDRAFFDWSPQLGLANPLAPPIYVDVEGDAVVGRARFGVAYEGPPGCVHGGYIAAAFDEVLGLAQTLSGQVGMTGTLTVKYRRPTPLHSDLRFEARLLSVVGRKVTVSAQLFCGDELTAEATGLFITITPEKFRMLSAYRDTDRPDVIGHPDVIGRPEAKGSASGADEAGPG